MQLPGERVKPLFEIRQVDGEFPRQAEKREVIGVSRQRLDFSARRAKVRAASRPGTAPARFGSCRCDGWCAHDLIILPPQNSDWHAWERHSPEWRPVKRQSGDWRSRVLEKKNGWRAPHAGQPNVPLIS